MCVTVRADRTASAASAAWYLSPINRTLEPNDANSLSPLWGVQQQHTFTCWFTPRPHSSRLTSTSAVSHKVIPCVTTVGGSLTANYTRTTKLAIGWVIWSFAWYNCWMKAVVSRTRQDKMMAIQSQCRGQNILLPTSHPYHSQQCK